MSETMVTFNCILNEVVINLFNVVIFIRGIDGEMKSQMNYVCRETVVAIFSKFLPVDESNRHRQFNLELVIIR